MRFVTAASRSNTGEHHGCVVCGGQILAEATLLGIVGCAMGLTAGALMSLNARGLARLTLGFVPDPFIPWPIITAGSAVVMLIALLASFWPAWTASRTEPLTLLQAGRAAT